MSDTITKFTYQTFQKSKAGFALAHKQISTYLENFIYPNLGLKTKPLSAKVIQKIQQRKEKSNDISESLFITNSRLKLLFLTPKLLSIELRTFSLFFGKNILWE